VTAGTGTTGTGTAGPAACWPLPARPVARWLLFPRPAAPRRAILPAAQPGRGQHRTAPGAGALLSCPVIAFGGFIPTL